MTEFWLVSALLLLPLMAFVLWPLVYRRHSAAAPARSAPAALYREHLAELETARTSGAVDEKQYRALEAELARNLLSGQGQTARRPSHYSGGRGLLIGLALVLPLLAGALYFYRGAYEGLVLQQLIAASQRGDTDAAQEAKITAALYERARAKPEDLTSRYVLAQRLMYQGDPAAAVTEYRFIVDRDPEAAGVRAELAQALFFAAGAQMTAAVRAELDAALERQPDNPTALGLAGIAAFNDRRYGAARDFWQRALAQQPASAAAAEALAAGVARAEAALAEAEGEAPANGLDSAAGGQQQASDTASSGDNGIAVEVALGSAVRVAAETPVFVYARNADNPMPLAIVRLTAADLPARVVLDESSAMVPGHSLKGADRVQLVARLAVHGDARPAPGDWQGEVESLARAQWKKPVAITIDRQL